MIHDVKIEISLISRTSYLIPVRQILVDNDESLSSKVSELPPFFSRNSPNRWKCSLLLFVVQDLEGRTDERSPRDKGKEFCETVPFTFPREVEQSRLLLFIFYQSLYIYLKETQEKLNMTFPRLHAIILMEMK